MSDTTEMVRLIRHAAALLRSAVDAERAFTGGTTEEQRRRSNTVAAAAVGHATLGLVAACMQPESEPNAQALARVRAKSWTDMGWEYDAGIEVWPRDAQDDEAPPRGLPEVEHG